MSLLELKSFCTQYMILKPLKNGSQFFTARNKIYLVAFLYFSCSLAQDEVVSMSVSELKSICTSL